MAFYRHYKTKEIMKNTLFVIALFSCVISANAQVRPDEAIEKTTAEDTDEIYSQYNGLLRRIKFSTAKTYFQQGVVDSIALLQDSIIVVFKSGVETHRDTIAGVGVEDSGGGSYALEVNEDTLFLNENSVPIDTVVFSIQSPPDTAFVEQGQLIIAFEGDFINADTLSLGTGRPVLENSLSTDTVILNYAESNIIRFNPTSSLVNHISFSNLETGSTYILDYQGTDTISLSDSLFQTGCANSLRFIGNSVLSFYSTGDSSYVYSSDSNLECYTQSIDAGPEYQAVLNYAISQSYSTPSLPVQSAQNDLINQLISIGAWASIDQFFCFVGDGDSNFSLINWKNPGTNNGSTIGSPTYTSNDGWNTNATTDAINSNYNPSTDASQLSTNNGTIGVWIEPNPGSEFYFGANASPPSRGEKWISTAETKLHGISITGSSLSSASTKLVQHTISGGNTLTTYSNGVSLNSGTGTATGTTNADIYIMSINLSNTPFNNSVTTSSKYRFYYVGGDLGSLANEIYNALSDYLTAIGL